MLQIELEVKVKIVEECSGSQVMININVLLLKLGAARRRGDRKKFPAR